VGWAIVTGATAPSGWAAPAPQWLVGGLIGGAVTFAVTRVVTVLGVLRLTLALVAGQSVGAIAVDVVAPAGGETVTVATVAGVLVTFVAIGVSGRTWQMRSRRV
jgi:transporter family-2 protein